MESKKLTQTILFSSLISTFAIGQTWTDELAQKKQINFNTVRSTFYQQKGRTQNPTSFRNTPKGKGVKQFKRWEYFWEGRLDTNGNLPKAGLIIEEWEKFHQNRIQNTSANWTFLGPKNFPTATAREYAGMGRINCLTFDPTNSNILWVGSPAGGVWKSSDGGQTWETNTDELPTLGVSTIIIDPTDSDIMYLATGDGDSGDTYGVGVLKSTDGGNTWTKTGLNHETSQTITITDLIINPTNTQILVASSNSGIYRTTDGGTNWKLVVTGSNFKDVVAQPNDFNTLLAGTNNNKIYRSTNAGVSWTQITSGLPTEGARVKLAFSESTPTKVYAIIADKANTNSQGIYVSTNSGTTWTAKNTTTNLLGGQAFYDMSIVVSPTNSNEIYAGGVNLYKSTNGGTSWTQITTGIPQNLTYVHSDHHNLYFKPNSNNTMYSVNDGGIHRVNTNNLTTWTDLSEGLHITQFYRIGGTPQNANQILAGAQDNDVAHFKNGQWFNRNNNSDGMECAFDYTNENIAYPCSQSGGLYRTTNGFTSRTYIKPKNAEYGNWTVPFVLDPINPTTMYIGFANLLKTTNVSTVPSGSDWTDLTSDPIGKDHDIINIAIAPSDNKTIYFSGKHYQGDPGTLQRSTNGGTSWTDITIGLPTSGSSYVTYIAVNSTNPQEIWVTCAGLTDGNKVYHSTNGGTSWANISENLPNIGIRCIAHETGTKGTIYIGTDFGVFYKNETMTNWVVYGGGLPNVIVNEIEIHYGVSKLRIATYGRGIWEAPLASVITALNPNQTLTNNVSIYPTICTNQVNVILNDNQNHKLILSNLAGGVHQIIDNVSQGTHTFDVSTLANGTYFVTIQNKQNTYTEKIIIE